MQQDGTYSYNENKVEYQAAYVHYTLNSRVAIDCSERIQLMRPPCTHRRGYCSAECAQSAGYSEDMTVSSETVWYFEVPHRPSKGGELHRDELLELLLHMSLLRRRNIGCRHPWYAYDHYLVLLDELTQPRILSSVG